MVISWVMGLALKTIIQFVDGIFFQKYQPAIGVPHDYGNHHVAKTFC